MAKAKEGLGAHESSERTFFRGDSYDGATSSYLEHGNQDTSLPVPPELPGGGTFVYLEYESRFERAAATEQFLYRITDDGPELVWFYITSDAFDRSTWHLPAVPRPRRVGPRPQQHEQAD